MTPYILIQCTAAPYSTSSSIDAFEAALAASNIGLHVKCVFMHDGVYQLVSAQDASEIKQKNMFKKLSALPLFDIEDCFVLSNCLIQRDLSKQQINNADIINSDQFNQLCQQAQHILVF
ncbi:MAG: sulfurtransferase complex subunit TusC [Glaciecola sp.]